MGQEFLNEIWQGYSSEIVSAFLAVMVAILLNFLRPKVSLIWGQANHSWHPIPIEENTAHVIAEKNFVQNLGRAPASSVEIIYQSAPTKLLIFPSRDYKTSTNPDGLYVVTLPYVAPKELIVLDGIFINKQLGNILSVKCKEKAGKKVNFWVLRKFPTWFYIVIWICLLFGFANFLIIPFKALV